MLGGYVGVGLVAISTCSGRREDAAFTRGQKRIAWATLAYFIFLFCVRLRETGVETLYEMMWGCNVSMAQAIVGVLTSRRILVSSAVTTVLIDQLCWYVDVGGYIATGGFPIGVASYLLREHVSITKKITACHHLWFLPTYVGILGRGNDIRAESWIVTVAITSFLIVHSRMFIPFQIERPPESGLDKPVYMNVNLAYEFWDDVDVPFLHALDGQHPAFYLPYAVVLCNVVLNGPPFLCLWYLSRRKTTGNKRDN